MSGNMDQPPEGKKEVSQKGDAENLPQEASALEHTSAFKNLGILDRFLVVWILLAIIIGILLGNFVPETGPALQRGQFVGVSVPIGGDCALFRCFSCADPRSDWVARHDVSNPLQGPL